MTSFEETSLNIRTYTEIGQDQEFWGVRGTPHPLQILCWNRQDFVKR